MPGFGDLVQKAFYLGVGAASYAAEKAAPTLADLRTQAQKLVDEMVARGEMTTEEAKRMVDDVVSRAQQPDPSAPSPEPRRIEILVEDEPSDASAAPSASQPSASQTGPASESQTAAPSAPPSAVDDLRQQVAKLQEELRRLRQE